MVSKSILTKSVAAIVVLTLSLAMLARISLTQERSSDRIGGAIDERSLSVIQGHLHPLAQSQFDQGRLDPLLTLNRITMTFKRTAAQQAGLDSLLKEQQDPSSPN